MRKDNSKWVTFASTLPTEDATDPHPKGYQVALRILRGLEAEGVTGIELDNWRDSGYSLECALSGIRVYLFISFLGDGPRQWVLCCTADVGFLARLRGRDASEEVRQLARHVDTVLSNDARTFSQVRWYTSRWEGRGDEEWQNRYSE
jgi:hypothetical protein